MDESKSVTSAHSSGTALEGMSITDCDYIAIKVI